MDAIQRLCDLPNGCIITAGATGTGKTTLLYSMLNWIQRPERPRANILTVEDPVEYVLPDASQMAVNRKAGLTYAAALRAIFQSDPDVVMIAELRDLETTELALQIGFTGHLVLSSVHAGSALEVIQLLRNMGVDAYVLAQTVVGVMAQRLARRVCAGCAEEYTPSEPGLKQLGLTAEDGPFRRGVGCEACRNSGYRGRALLLEVLEVDSNVGRLIAGDAPIQALWQETFVRNGGSLWDDAREKVRQGITTVEEASRAMFGYPHPLAGKPIPFSLSRQKRH